MNKVVLLGFILSLNITQAQDENFETIFGPHEPKRAQFGFNLGVNYSNLIDNPVLDESMFVTNGMGIRLGLVSDIRLTNWFFTSPKVELSFHNSSVTSTLIDGSQTRYNLFPTSLEFMNHFTFKSSKLKNSPYFYVGPDVKLNIQKPENSTDFTTKLDFAIDFGIGLDSRIKYFNFAPEIRYSLGLMNVNTHPQIQSLKFHNVALVLNFKG